MTTEPQSHTTIVRTDFAPDEVIVRGGDGRWFRVLNWLVDAGLWGRLPANQKAVLFILLRFRRPDGLVVEPIHTIGDLAGLKRSATYDAIQGLLAHPAGLLAASGASYVVLPELEFAGRGGAPPPSATADTPVRNGGRFSAAADDAQGNARAPTTQIKTVVRSKPERSDRISDAALARWIKAREQGMGGWAGFPLWWSLDGVNCPTLALTMLDVRTFVRTDLLAIVERSGQPLTVAEIAAQVEQIRMDRTVRNPPVVLAVRLARARGGEIDTVKRARQREQRRDDTLNRLREIRHNEARQRAGGLT